MKSSCQVVLFTSLLLVSILQPSVAQQYELVWSDEFNGDSIDTDTWVFWEGPAYNEELQFYTARPENAFIKEGHLYLQAQKESYNGMEYTSARISTDSTQIGWEHGRFEARIKMPKGKGFWPAFWLMPMREVGWPRGGEIDIMEFRGNEPYTTTGALHFWQADCDGNPMDCRKYLTDSITLSDENLTDDFHTYSLEWTEDELIWFLDDNEFFRVGFNEFKADYEPFSGPFHIILNLAVGGNFLPNPDETTEFPQALVVDYVRVYQKP